MRNLNLTATATFQNRNPNAPTSAPVIARKSWSLEVYAGAGVALGLAAWLVLTALHVF